MKSPESVPRGVRNPLHFTLGERLKKARLAAGVQPTILARKVGLSAPTVTNIEQGRVPGLDVVERLARGLSMSPCLLAYGVDAGAVPGADEPLRCASIGQRLRAARELAGLSLRQLSEDTRPAPRPPHNEALPTAVSHTTIRLTEDGDTIPSVATAEALANALRVSPCWLSFGEGEPSGPRFPPPISKRKPTAPRRVRKATPRGAGNKR